MTIMSKRGNLDNVVTYEHICDTTADMQKIDSKYITLGSTCIVISGDTGGMEVYLADSNKTWNPLGMISGGGGGGDGGGSSGSGITVIECEMFEENEHTYLRNAGQLVAAIDDIEKNPAHFVNYALVLVNTATPDHKPFYALCYAMSTSTDDICFRDSENSILYGGSKSSGTGFYVIYWGFVFEASDVDENGIATLRVNDM